MSFPRDAGLLMWLRGRRRRQLRRYSEVAGTGPQSILLLILPRQGSRSCSWTMVAVLLLLLSPSRHRRGLFWRHRRGSIRRYQLAVKLLLLLNARLRPGGAPLLGLHGLQRWALRGPGLLLSDSRKSVEKRKGSYGVRHGTARAGRRARGEP